MVIICSNLRKKLLVNKIKKKRSQMIFLGEKLGFTDKQTVACSQELDKLLNLYQQYQCKNDKKGKWSVLLFQSESKKTADYV
ncbi:aspartyl-phosphate phosphatase Spo0E family protein [Rossellomorea sp. BNER]|uniref:aspartyl-phosphate phosphatase Spo0E family protein n=1 Tax=Rossellomorea sp. BNER TaxID=2962031 RepID=UPI003AF29EDC